MEPLSHLDELPLQQTVTRLLGSHNGSSRDSRHRWNSGWFGRCFIHSGNLAEEGRGPHLHKYTKINGMQQYQISELPGLTCQQGSQDPGRNEDWQQPGC